MQIGGAAMRALVLGLAFPQCGQCTINHIPGGSLTLLGLGLLLLLLR